MKIPDLLSCAKPLFFENNDEEFCYSFIGTCFLGNYRGKYYIITARHCLKEGWTPNDIRVDCDAESRSFLPLKTFHKMEMPTTDPEDWSWTDLAFVEVDTVKVSNRSALTEPLCVDFDYLETVRLLPPKGSNLILKGYPSALNQISHEKKKLLPQGFLTNAKYAGRSNYKHCHHLEFYEEFDPVGDPDGMSGAPIFHTQNIAEGKSIYSFAGVLINGSSDRGLFIEASVVFTALHKLATLPS